MAVPCQVSPQKDTCAGFSFFFHNVLLHYQHHISKIEDLFCSLIFLDFRTVCCGVPANNKTSFMDRYNIYICTGPPCTLASSKHMRILTLAKRQISFVLQTTKMHFSQLKCNKFGNTYIIDYSNNIFLHPSFFVSENQQDHFLLIVLNVSKTCFLYSYLLF